MVNEINCLLDYIILKYKTNFAKRHPMYSCHWNKNIKHNYNVTNQYYKEKIDKLPMYH
jgi:hypothetical protein